MLPKNPVQSFLDVPGMEARKIDKMEIKTGLGSGGDDQEWNQGEGDGVVPEQTGDHQGHNQIKAVEKLPVGD